MSAGAVQARSICVPPITVSASPVGLPGAPMSVAAFTVSDTGPVPAELIAEIR